MAISNHNEEQLLDFYQKIRKNINKSADDFRIQNSQGKHYDIGLGKFIRFLAIFPDIVHLSIKLLFDKTVPSEKKGSLVAAIGYLVSPIDIIPDALPVYGFVDDLIVLAIALNSFIDTSDPNIKKAIEKYWAGDENIIDTIKHILEVFDSAVEFLPKKLLKIVKDSFPKPVNK